MTRRRKRNSSVLLLLLFLLPEMSHEKRPAMLGTTDAYSKAMFGMTYTEARVNGVCVLCHAKADEFRDDESRNEYEISATCQTCQSKVFSVDDVLF